VGFLSPLLLLAAVAIGVPLLLHLFHRHEGRRISFPALRYLLRTEREHARRIKLRQLLLLLLRVSLLLLIALAGARPFLRGGGGAHPPTALAIVIDNSMSSGRVVEGERVLDRLKQAALAAIAQAGEDDRIWVLRAGEPWDVATPGDAVEARARVAATEVSAAGADVAQAARRGSALVRQAGLPGAEVHLLTDLQATAFVDSPDPVPDVPVLVFQGADGSNTGNRYLGSVLVGGGLPPLTGRRTELAVGLGGDTVEAPLRLIVEDRIRGASRVAPGSTSTLPFGPFDEGWVFGHVETDPDDLSGDDRRWFALAVRPPPVVTLRGSGEDAYFLDEAVAVLADAGRVRRQGEPDVVIAVGAEGAAAVSSGRTVVIVPPADPALLPGVNRRLTEAGIPWRYEASQARGEAAVGETRLPVPLDEVRVAGGYRLVGATDTGFEVAARLTDGSPWLVVGTLGAGSYRLVGSPLAPEATNLPVSAFMIPLLEWLVAPPGGDGGLQNLAAGDALTLPGSATAVQTPDGAVHPVDGTQDFRATREAGVYRVLAGDSLLELVAVNPPVSESLLAPAELATVARALGPELRVIDEAETWSDAVFTERQGRELWRPLMIAVLLLLLVESWAAASGAAPERARAPSAPPEPAATVSAG
jgi:hypothetical protein